MSGRYTTRAQALAGRWWARWGWQPDKWERLSTVAILADACPGSRVVDVGGRGRELAGLLHQCHVTSINVEQPCDVQIEPGDRLPFDDDTFDIATSTDVLEHVPPVARMAHLAELARVSRARLVLCFPAGSSAKDDSERRLQAQLWGDHGVRLAFLEEHIAHGLPRAQDVAALAADAAPGAAIRVVYQDGAVEAEETLLDAFRAVKGRQVGAFARSARRWLVRRRPVLTARRSEDNNRAYVVIDLAP